VVKELRERRGMT